MLKEVINIKNIDFIKEFSKISVSKICKDKKINSSLLYNKPNQPKQLENAKIVKEEIKKRIAKLINDDYESCDEDGK